MLDPFMGSGSALVAAARLGRRYVGYDLDARYVDIARRRVAAALEQDVTLAATAQRARPRRYALAEALIERAGFTIDGRAPAHPRHRGHRRPRRRRRRGDHRGCSTSQGRCSATVAGCCGPTRCGRRSDAPAPSRAPASTLPRCPAHQPAPPSPQRGRPRAARRRSRCPFDVVDMLTDDGPRRLRRYAGGRRTGRATTRVLDGCRPRRPRSPR